MHAQAHSGFCGATLILKEHLLQDIAERMESDLFLLLSSMNEIVILPAVDRDELKRNEAVLHDLNREQGIPGEYLTDSVYLYDKEQKCLRNESWDAGVELVRYVKIPVYTMKWLDETPWRKTK